MPELFMLIVLLCVTLFVSLYAIAGVPDLLELFQVFDAHVVVACLADRLQVFQRRLTARGGRLDMTALEGVVADRPNAYVALTFNHVAVAVALKQCA